VITKAATGGEFEDEYEMCFVQLFPGFLTLPANDLEAALSFCRVGGWFKLDGLKFRGLQTAGKTQDNILSARSPF
jgi:hypothetical protein